MLTYRKNNPAIVYLIRYWNKHCTINDWHIEWLKHQIQIYNLKKDDNIYLQGDRQKSIYFVCSGILARIFYDSNFKLHIISIALPGSALMTTTHLFSDTPSIGHIIALRSNTKVIKIPYRTIHNIKEKDVQIDTLMNIISNKKKQQLIKLRILSTITQPSQRYLWYTENMPEIHQILTNKESAFFLNISIDTVYRSKRIWRKS